MSYKNQKKLVFILSIILTLTVLVTIFIKNSSAWFASDVDPVIYSDTMQIVSSEGLNIQLESANATDPDIKEEINLKDVVKDITDYTMLDQLSSSNGINLYKRIDDDGLISYTEVKDGTGYIEITILMVNSSETTTLTREAFLSEFEFKLVNSNGEVITNNRCAEDAIRMSMEIENYQGVISTYIMCLERQPNTLNRYDNFIDLYGNAYASTVLDKNPSDNRYYINKNAIYTVGLSDESDSMALQKAVDSNNINSVNDAINCRTNQIVYYPTAFMKYINNVYNSNYISLTQIPSGKTSKFTFRLWLEGSDPRCEIPISGSKISLYIKFGNETLNN